MSFANINKDPNAVDLGLSVMWSTFYVPNSNNSSITAYYAFYNIPSSFPSPFNQYWRLPTKEEIENMINNLSPTYITSYGPNNKEGVVVTGNNNTVFFEKTNYKTPGDVWGTGITKRTVYFWSSTEVPAIVDSTSTEAYAFKGYPTRLWGTIHSKIEIHKAVKTYYIPIRPVIDTVKVKIIGEVSDDPNVSIASIEQVLPEGAGFDIVADGGNCYEFVRWDDNDVNNTSARRSFTDVRNGKVYKAIFKKKKYSVSAYIKNGDSDAKYSSKVGNLECGQDTTISVPIDNCYVFQGWEGPGITRRLAAGQEADGYSCQVDNSVSPTQASLTIPNIDSNTQLNRDYTAYFSIKTTNVKATTEDNQKGTVGLSIGNENN